MFKTNNIEIRNYISCKKYVLLVIKRTFRGIVDRDSFVDYMISNLDADADVINFIINDLLQNDIFEYRNLLMSGKGYHRMVKIFSELQSVKIAESMGTKLSIGRTIPKSW